jgi:hypothetical protein
MIRRKFLTGLGAGSISAIAGCVSSLTATGEPPDGAYIPSHMDMMEMIGMQKAGRLMISLSYTSPHEFFVVTGSRKNKTEIQEGDTMHLMALVHDMKTGVIAPQVEPTISISKNGQQVVSNQPWPMLSQPMGYHFGDNVNASGEATYRFDVTVNAARSVLPDDLSDVFTKQSVTFEKTFDPASASDLGVNQTGDKARTKGALSPMDMEMMSIPQQPAYGDIPLQLTEPQYTDDVAVAVGRHDDPIALGFDEGESALVAATQTRYNRYPLGFMGLEATVSRDGSEVYSGELTSAVHGDIGHYYGAWTPMLEPGDSVDIEFVTPPQVARHIGYETAFFELEPLSFTL